MTFLQWLTSTLGTAVIICALVGAFWKVIMNRVTASVKSRYDKELETHIDALRHKTDLALKDFEAKANERNIKLTGIFTKQADTIVTTHHNLVLLYRAFQRSTEALGLENNEKQERHEALTTAYNKFASEFTPNQIYIPRTARLKIDEFVYTLESIARQNKMFESFLTLRTNNEDVIKRFETKIDLLTVQLPNLWQQVEAEFEKLLGTSDKINA